MARLQVVTAGPLAAASATAIRTASTAAAGQLVLNGTLANAAGTLATMDHPRRVLLTFAGDETGKTFTLTGTGPGGAAISETIAGTAAGTVQSVLDYSTVSVFINVNSAGNISVGTNGVGGSGWVQFDRYALGAIAAQLTVSGTVNYTLQQSLDDPNRGNLPQGASTITPATMTWVNTSDVAAVGATTTVQTNYLFPPVWARILLNSGSGTVTGTFVQGG